MDPSDMPMQPAAPQPSAPYVVQPAASPPARSGRGGSIAIGILLGLMLAVLGGCCAVVTTFGTIGSAVSGLGATSSSGRDGIALIHIDSVIQDSSSGARGGANPERLIKLLRAADKDPRVKSIMLRVNSPGGTVSASQEIAMEVARVKKPVIADIGDMGASGAYYIASQCDTIVASPSSAVGSIGVILDIPDIQELMKKLGVSVTVIKEGKYKDAGSPYRDLKPDERALLEKSMRPAYDQFIADVAKGRHLPEKQVREWATGMVWPGVEAQKMGLVDSIGNYEDAVRMTAAAGGLKSGFAVIEYDKTDVVTTIQQLLGAAGQLGPLGAFKTAEGTALAR